MIIKNARIYTPEHTFKTGDLTIRDGRIAFGAPPLEGEEVLDAQGLYALPGLVDIHFHGAMGKDFCDGKEEAIQTLADFEASKGVLAICPATMTYPEEILNKVMENVYTSLDVTEMASILSDVANYQIVAQDGVPFEDSRTTGTNGKKGYCVIPLDLETNVVKLHELLFDVTEYEPSDQVKQYSQKVQADTSQYMKK